MRVAVPDASMSLLLLALAGYDGGTIRKSPTAATNSHKPAG